MDRIIGEISTLAISSQGSGNYRGQMHPFDSPGALTVEDSDYAWGAVRVKVQRSHREDCQQGW